MEDPAPRTAQLHRWLDRLQAGDLAAREELLRSVGNRLEHLARKMLRRFPRVQHWVQTGDVLQSALLRLLRALETVQPASVRDFFGLAAEQMRRELLDLARHFYGPLGPGTHLATPSPGDTAPSSPPEPPDPSSEEREELERWCAFHVEVARLPEEEREVVGLVFYHGWTQAEVADLVGLSVRTVRRRWDAALVRLHRLLKEDGGPDSSETLR